MDLTTKPRVKTMLNSGGIDVGAEIDTLIEQMVSTYSAHVEKYLNRKTQTAERTELFDVEPWQRVFILDAYPVSSVSSVKHASDRDFASVDAEDADDYYADLPRGTIDLDASFTPGRGTVQIVYTGGMASDADAFVAAYPDIAQAVDMQVAYVISRKDQLGSAGIGMGAGNVSYTGAVDLLPEVRRILNQHRRLLP